MFSAWFTSARLSFWRRSGLPSRTPSAAPPNCQEQGHQDSLRYYYYSFTTSCIVTSPRWHSHTTTQKEHVLSEFKGDLKPLWKKPSQREAWKNEPEAVTGVFWKLVFKRPPFPSHSICSLTLPLTPGASCSRSLPQNLSKRQKTLSYFLTSQENWNGLEYGKANPRGKIINKPPHHLDRFYNWACGSE